MQDRQIFNRLFLYLLIGSDPNVMHLVLICWHLIYNLQSTFAGFSFYHADVTPWIIGGILAVVTGWCLLGGGSRIVKVTSTLVPVMGVAYIVVALIVVVINIGYIPTVFATIFEEAFDFKAIFGVFAGSAMMQGIRRGLYSNEAGIGSAPNAATSANVSHPVKQGLVQMLSVFIDTLLLCTATAMMCMSSDVVPSEALQGAPWVQAALQESLGTFGPVFITVSMVLFAFTTLLGNCFYSWKPTRTSSSCCFPSKRLSMCLWKIGRAHV